MYKLLKAHTVLHVINYYTKHSLTNLLPQYFHYSVPVLEIFIFSDRWLSLVTHTQAIVVIFENNRPIRICDTTLFFILNTRARVNERWLAQKSLEQILTSPHYISIVLCLGHQSIATGVLPSPIKQIILFWVSDWWHKLLAGFPIDLLLKKIKGAGSADPE